VRVRTVEPERVEAWIADARSRRVASDVAIEDLATEDRIAETNRLFEALQVPEKAPGAYVLGMSLFTQDKPIPTGDAALLAFARQIGADYVVVAQQAAKVRQTALQPVTTFSSSTATGQVTGAGGAGPTGYATGTSTSTTMAPVQVDRDAVAHAAFFVRRRRPQDPPFP
jgi:hypothetical protein